MCDEAFTDPLEIMCVTFVLNSVCQTLIITMR